MTRGEPSRPSDAPGSPGEDRKGVERLVYLAEFLPTYVYREVCELSARGVDIELYLPVSTETSDRWRAIVRESGNVENLHIHRDLPFELLSCPPSQVVLSALLLGVPAFLRHPVRFFRALARALAGRSLRYFLLGASAARAVRGRPSVVHAHFAEHAAHAGFWASRILGVPFTVTTHAVDIFRPANEDRTRRLLHQADRILTISEFNREYMTARYGSDLQDRITVTHLGLDVDSLPGRKEGRGDPPIILCTASGLGEKKGVPVLIRCCRRLLGKDLAFRCTVIGSDNGGELLNRYRMEVERSGLSGVMEFPGFVPSDRVLEMLAGSDIFVLPCVEAPDGNMDGIPVSLMEAMAMGVPTVSSYISGIPELIEHGRTGMLVKPGDDEGLASVLEDLLMDPGLSCSLGRAGSGRVREEFELTLYADRLLDVWSSPDRLDP